MPDEIKEIAAAWDIYTRSEECPKYISIEDRLSRTEFSWLMKAVKVAELAEGRSMHGAVVVKGGSLLGVGINRSRVHGKWIQTQSRHLCTVHAELSAMRNADYPIGSTLYVARVNRNGELRPSAPCQSCANFLEHFQVKKVVHT